MNVIFVEDDETFKREVIPWLQKNNVFGMDVESSGFDPYTETLLLLQIASYDAVYVINVGKVQKRLITYGIELIKESKKLVIGHNIRFDLKFIKHNFGVIPENVFDTMLAETLSYAGIGKSLYSLEYLAKKYLAVTMQKETRYTFIGKQDFEFTLEQIKYSALDVEVLLSLKDALENNLKQRGQFNTWEEIERPLIPVVAMMEYYGVTLDQELWKALEKEMIEIAEDYSVRLNQYLFDNFSLIAGNHTNALEACENIGIKVGTKRDKLALSSITSPDEIARVVVADWVNLNSPKQLLYILQCFEVPVEDTNRKTLEKYKGFEIVKLLLGYRPAIKKTTSFGDKILSKVNSETGKLHGSFNQLGTYTGRFSSSNPNLQQIPRDKRYRHAFVASPGHHLITIDYSQIELRLMGEISGETKFIDAYLNNQDLHSLTASLVKEKPLEEVTSEDRQLGKTINFAVIYGTTRKGLFYNFGIPEKDAQTYLDNYFKQYNIIRDFKHAAEKQIIKKGYSVTLTGRRRFFTIPKSPTGKDMHLLLEVARQGINHIVQGTSADMTKLAMCIMYHNNPFGDRFRILMTVHDELVVEVSDEILDEAISFIEECMVKAGKRFLKVIPVAFGKIVDITWSK